MDILELVTSALESIGIPVIYGWYDSSLNSTHCTFLEFDNGDGDYADDEARTTEHYIQVDIWTRDIEEGQRLKSQVKKLLKEKEFLYQDGGDIPEPQNDNTILWHIATRWLIEEDLE